MNERRAAGEETSTRRTGTIGGNKGNEEKIGRGGREGGGGRVKGGGEDGVKEGGRKLETEEE